MAECPRCGSDNVYMMGDDPAGLKTCGACNYKFYRPHNYKADADLALALQRIAIALEKIERHMAFNNGTLEGMTRNYDPSAGRR